MFKMVEFRTLCICFLLYISQGSCAGAALDGNNEDDASCYLHTLPKNGQYMVLANDNQDPKPGEIVPNGTVLYYTCNPGFKPVTSDTAICLGNEWVTDFSRCQPTKTCNLPEELQNGQYYLMMNGVPSFGTPGQIVPEWAPLIYVCDTQYELVGENISLCRDGAWSTKPPLCQKSKKCVMPEKPANGNYVILGNDENPTPGANAADLLVLSYECNEGYELNEGPVLVCRDGLWIGGNPSCTALTTNS